MSPEEWQALEDNPRVTIAANGSFAEPGEQDQEERS